jgi:hypothetical protein
MSRVVVAFVAFWALCTGTNYTGWTLNECGSLPKGLLQCEVWGRNSQSHLLSVACPPNHRPNNCTLVVPDVLATAHREALGLR